MTAGLNRARAQGKRLGRRPIPAGKIAKVMDARSVGLSIRKIAAKIGSARPLYIRSSRTLEECEGGGWHPGTKRSGRG